MLNFLKNVGGFARIEFWASTTLFVFFLFFFVTEARDASAMATVPNKVEFEKVNVPFSFYRNYFFPVVSLYLCMYAAFMFLNFIVIPRVMKREAIISNLLLLALTVLALGAAFFIGNTYLKAYAYAGANSAKVNLKLFHDGFSFTFKLLLLFFIYTAIKYTGMYVMSKMDAIHRRYPFFRREAVAAAMIWLVTVLLLRIAGTDMEFLLAWMVMIPYSILFYSFAFHKVIPAAFGRKRPLLTYLLWSALIIALAFFPLFLLVLFILVEWKGGENMAFNISAFNTMFQAFVTVPVTWLLYKRQQKGDEEVTVLKKELRQSTASIEFLRSQINPHFLFNALNTLYGTAIQENADRTSEGIQKLGDMMRFMLQENMQEKIPLSREIDYLENYIALQRLRTDSNPNVAIQTSIDSRENMLQIAPMLLIPFVENAFKHGISFREPTHIKVKLEIKDKTLYFGVFNSKHIRHHTDPEKDKSGIGLENVSQRLKLLYPNRHELIIRDTPSEFFIHLTIQLA
ncbi:MAG TPA: histidine kinase [Chitinophagaceae bacterium]|nr:histidine kinase [Chitinophagaceae bacterium]